MKWSIIYVHDHLGGDSCFPNRGADLDQLSRKFLALPEFQEVISFNGEYALPTTDPEKQKKRRVFYVYSGSLVKYLMQIYGKEKLLQFYRQQDPVGVTGKTFEQLKTDWLQYLQAVEKQ